MAKKKTQYECNECGAKTPKWSGKCFTCGTFGSLVEEVELTPSVARGLQSVIEGTGDRKAKSLSEISKEDYDRYSTGIGELDRVLGDGIVKGSLILISGSPGMGKSTLLSTTVFSIAEKYGTVLYSSGEESVGQGKKRFEERMNITSENIKLLHTTDVSVIEENANELKPKLIIVDSIQTLADPTVASAPGSVTQVSTCAIRLMHYAKTTGTAIIVVGQVLKDNTIAGPKQLEHMVDTVLYLEGDRYSDLRLLRVVKNRFGNTNELGVFQMQESGMVEITNPSDFLLANRLKDATGSAVVCISDTRPLMIEVQALTAAVGNPNANARRASEGFSRNRLSIIVAVLEKKCKADLTFKDIYVNVVGGMEIEEPGADLGVAMALYSSDKNVSIDPETVIIGEIGLSGEVRPVANVEQLIKECERVGFARCVLPKGNFERVKNVVKSMTLQPVETVAEAITTIF